MRRSVMLTGCNGTPPSRRGVTVMPERADSHSRPASLAAR
jgi:hypothetical protein